MYRQGTTGLTDTKFLTAKADCGTVVWDDDIDIAPEHLYESSTPM